MISISFKEEALGDLIQMQKADQQRVFLKLLEILAANQAMGDPLSNSLKGFWKIRIGNYRVVYRYKTEARMIEVLAVGKREDLVVYKSAALRIS